MHDTGNNDKNISEICLSSLIPYITALFGAEHYILKYYIYTNTNNTTWTIPWKLQRTTEIANYMRLELSIWFITTSEKPKNICQLFMSRFFWLTNNLKYIYTVSQNF